MIGDILRVTALGASPVSSLLSFYEIVLSSCRHIQVSIPSFSIPSSEYSCPVLLPLRFTRRIMSADSFSKNETHFKVIPVISPTCLRSPLTLCVSRQFQWPQGITGLERIALTCKGDLQRTLRCYPFPADLSFGAYHTITARSLGSPSL